MHMKSKEDDLQASCIKWFRLQYKKHGILLFAIPNGGKRNAREAAKLKRTGVTAGVADLFLSIPNGQHNGFYIELKVGYNKPTASQIEFSNQVIAQGFKWEVVKTFQDFRKVVDEYLDTASL